MQNAVENDISLSLASCALFYHFQESNKELIKMRLEIFPPRESGI
jgi:hypothetical protein